MVFASSGLFLSAFAPTSHSAISVHFKRLYLPMAKGTQVMTKTEANMMHVTSAFPSKLLLQLVLSTLPLSSFGFGPGAGVVYEAGSIETLDLAFNSEIECI